VLHAVAYANPEEALGGNFLHTKWPDVATALHVSAYSLKAITMAALPLMSGGGSVVGWISMRAWPGQATTGWAWQGRAGILCPLPGRDLGEKKVRVNLVAAGRCALWRPSPYRVRAVRGGMGQPGAAGLGH